MNADQHDQRDQHLKTMMWSKPGYEIKLWSRLIYVHFQKGFHLKILLKLAINLQEVMHFRKKIILEQIEAGPLVGFPQ